MGYSNLIESREIFPNCINCDTIFNLSADKEKKKSKQIAHTQIRDLFVEDHSNSLEFEHDISLAVSDAIFYIYGISHSNLIKEICDSSHQLTSDSDNYTFALCEKCAPVISDIYKAHRQLDKISNEKSVLAKSIKKQRLSYTDFSIKIEHGWESNYQESQDEKCILGGFGESESPILFTQQSSNETESDIDIHFDPLAVENEQSGREDAEVEFSDTADQCYYTNDEIPVADSQQVVVCKSEEEAQEVEVGYENPMPIIWQALPISVYSTASQLQAVHPGTSRIILHNSNEKQPMNGNQKRKATSKYETYSTIQPEVSTMSESNCWPTPSDAARNNVRRKVKAIPTVSEQFKLIKAINDRNSNDFPTPLTSKKDTYYLHKKSKGSIQRHKCPKCFKTYFTVLSLKNHLKTHEADYQPIRCELCPAEYESNHGLQNHLKYNHN